MQQSDMTQILALLRSPAGQQLMAYFNQNSNPAAQAAAAQAAAGDIAGAKNTLAPMLEDPILQNLLRQLGGKP